MRQKKKKKGFQFTYIKMENEIEVQWAKGDL